MKITTMSIKYQLVPPNNHRENNVERAIKTFKNHFIVGICSVHQDLHLQLWYILLQQAITSLNFLRQSVILHHLSDYTHIYEELYYNRTLLAPLGKRIVIHNSPNNRA